MNKRGEREGLPHHRRKLKTLKNINVEINRPSSVPTNPLLKIAKID